MSEGLFCRETHPKRFKNETDSRGPLWQALLGASKPRCLYPATRDRPEVFGGPRVKGPPLPFLQSAVTTQHARFWPLAGPWWHDRLRPRRGVLGQGRSPHQRGAGGQKRHSPPPGWPGIRAPRKPRSRRLWTDATNFVHQITKW